jgi:hypothetical protein
MTSVFPVCKNQTMAVQIALGSNNSGVCVAHFGLLQSLCCEPLGQGLGTELGYLVGAGVDLSGEDESIQTVDRRQRLEQLVNVLVGQRILAPGHAGRVVLLAFLQEAGFVLTLLDGKVLTFVELHRFLKR